MTSELTGRSSTTRWLERRGAIRVAFVSADPFERAVEINTKIAELGLAGLLVKVLFNPVDYIDQPAPTEEHGHFRTWDEDAGVPAGEFHLAISRVQ